MNSREFDSQYEDLIVAPLTAIGFRTHGQSLSYTKDQTIFALIRFQMRGSGLMRTTHFIACVRHLFLRDMEKSPVSKFLSCVSEYPFKLPVSKLSLDFLKSWRYQPQNLSPREYDTVTFGELNDASRILLDIKQRVIHSGLAWMERLTPAEALNQISAYGEGAYCEKIWIEDYEAFLRQSS